MNGRPSNIRVLGASLVADPYAPQFRAYRYGGDQPLEQEPEKTRPDAPVCEMEGCGEPPHTVRLCVRHYYAYREALKKDPSLLRPPVKGVFRPDKCGTTTGHQRHVYYKQAPCDACRAAKNADKRRRDQLKKEAAA